MLSRNALVCMVRNTDISDNSSLGTTLDELRSSLRETSLVDVIAAELNDSGLDDTVCHWTKIAGISQFNVTQGVPSDRERISNGSTSKQNEEHSKQYVKRYTYQYYSKGQYETGGVRAYSADCVKGHQSGVDKSAGQHDPGGDLQHVARTCVHPEKPRRCRNPRD